MKDLHGGGGPACVHLLPNQLVGHAVVMPLQLHVVIDVHPQSLPVAKAVRLGGQRSQDGAIQLAEQIPAAALTFLEGPMIQPIPQFCDGLVQSF